VTIFRQACSLPAASAYDAALSQSFRPKIKTTRAIDGEKVLGKVLSGQTRLRTSGAAFSGWVDLIINRGNILAPRPVFSSMKKHFMTNEHSCVPFITLRIAVVPRAQQATLLVRGNL